MRLRFLTFFNNNIGGRLISTMFIIFSNKFPCSRSSKPCFLPSDFLETPAMENGWHGKPTAKYHDQVLDLHNLFF